MTEVAMRPVPGHRILLVEGAARAQEGLCRVLERLYTTAAVASPSEGLAILSRDRGVAVTLCDEELPGMPGIEFLERVRELSPATVGILLARRGRAETVVRASLRRGMHCVLADPCSAEDLRSAVDAAIELHDVREAELLAAGELEFLNASLQGLTARLEERVLAQSASLRRLHRLAVELNAAHTLQDVARLAAEAVHDSFSSRGVHVQVWDPEQVCVEWNLGPEMSSAMQRVPIQTCDGPVGELVVDALGPHGAGLERGDLDVLASIASSTAVAVHNELRRRERDQAQYATIVALARLSEQRDNETGKHLERVSLYCKLVAEGLRAEGHYTETIDDVFVRDLERSAPLHDIGKVGIPDSILLKPGKLSPEEWEIMKTHAELGAATLRSVMLGNRAQGFLEMGHDIALYHHEKWDGTGYPRGLAGLDIPLPARILTLADVYDALTTVRPYKQAWPHERAIAWIRQGAGSHFDPHAVQVFLRREREVDQIRARLADEVDAFSPGDRDVLVSRT